MLSAIDVSPADEDPDFEQTVTLLDQSNLKDFGGSSFPDGPGAEAGLVVVMFGSGTRPPIPSRGDILVLDGATVEVSSVTCEYSRILTNIRSAEILRQDAARLSQGQLQVCLLFTFSGGPLGCNTNKQLGHTKRRPREIERTERLVGASG